MRALLTTISLDPERGGGTAERTLHLARHLHALGTDCRVVTMEAGRYADALAAESIPVEVTRSVRIRYQVPLLNLARLRKLVSAADVVHVLGYWNLLSVATCALSRICGKPYVLCAAGEFAGLERPRLDQRLFHAGFGLGMITHAALIIAITALERDQIIQRLGVDPKRVVVVPNGVEPPPASADGGSLWPAGRFVLFMGRLAPIKGPDLLLEAFANVSSKFPDVSLVFAGPDFGMRPALEQRVAELGLAHRVRFAGFLDERARWGAYRRAAFLAVPSRAEAMSLVALEAAAAGTPVLISDQCGFNEIRASGGGVVVTADVRGLSGGLSDMLGEGADLCEMGSKLKSFVLETYAWPNVAGKLRDYLSGLTGPRAT